MAAHKKPHPTNQKDTDKGIQQEHINQPDRSHNTSSSPHGSGQDSTQTHAGPSSHGNTSQLPSGSRIIRDHDTDEHRLATLRSTAIGFDFSLSSRNLNQALAHLVQLRWGYNAGDRRPWKARNDDENSDDDEDNGGSSTARKRQKRRYEQNAKRHTFSVDYHGGEFGPAEAHTQDKRGSEQAPYRIFVHVVPNPYTRAQGEPDLGAHEHRQPTPDNAQPSHAQVAAQHGTGEVTGDPHQQPPSTGNTTRSQATNTTCRSPQNSITCAADILLHAIDAVDAVEPVSGALSPRTDAHTGTLAPQRERGSATQQSQVHQTILEPTAPEQTASPQAFNQNSEVEHVDGLDNNAPIFQNPFPGGDGEPVNIHQGTRVTPSLTPHSTGSGPQKRKATKGGTWEIQEVNKKEEEELIAQRSGINSGNIIEGRRARRIQNAGRTPTTHPPTTSRQSHSRGSQAPRGIQGQNMGLRTSNSSNQSQSRDGVIEEATNARSSGIQRSMMRNSIKQNKGAKYRKSRQTSQAIRSAPPGPPDSDQENDEDDKVKKEAAEEIEERKGYGVRPAPHDDVLPPGYRRWNAVNKTEVQTRVEDVTHEEEDQTVEEEEEEAAQETQQEREERERREKEEHDELYE